MKYRFRDKTHPAAAGRQPKHGDEAFGFWIETDEGARLRVEFGRAGFLKMAATVLSMLADDGVLDGEAREAMASVKVGEGEG